MPRFAALQVERVGLLLAYVRCLDAEVMAQAPNARSAMHASLDWWKRVATTRAPDPERRHAGGRSARSCRAAGQPIRGHHR